MPIQFKLSERVIGYAAATSKPGEMVPICYRELIGPADAAHLQRQLENLNGSLFSKIPTLPLPSLIDHVLVVIRPDLECTAYINELSIFAQAKTTRGVQAGAPVYATDIADITSVEIGVDVPPDCGLVFMRSTGWKRSLFFDFGPLLPEHGHRTYSLPPVYAQQTLLLLGILPDTLGERPEGEQTRLQRMEEGLAELKLLLSNRCEQESKYQELLHRNPWMLGGHYSEVLRHRSFDDHNIPDFTAVRCYDRCHDIIELKQPFLTLNRKNGEFTADFNEAWNQAERYLSFATQQRNYLGEEKELRFENPRCVLLLGYGLSERDLRNMRKKESFVRSVSVFTYDHLVETATHIVSLMKTANERVVTSTNDGLANSGLQLPSARNVLP
jgi:hypothetical protein